MKKEIHPDRASCCNRHHRHPRRYAAARLEQSKSVSTPDRLCQQFEINWNCHVIVPHGLSLLCCL